MRDEKQRQEDDAVMYRRFLLSANQHNHVTRLAFSLATTMTMMIGRCSVCRLDHDEGSQLVHRYEVV